MFGFTSGAALLFCGSAERISSTLSSEYDSGWATPRSTMLHSRLKQKPFSS